MSLLRRKKRKPILASEIYDAYPAAALLRVPSPKKGERVDRYFRRLDGRYGDALFEYILHSFAERPFHRKSGLQCLENATNDLLLLMTKLSRKEKKL